MSSFFRYDTNLENQIEGLLGADRFAPYLAAMATDRCEALKLYVWNAALASAFLSPIGALEVGLRNALNTSLTTSYGVAWYDDPTFLALDPTGHLASQISRAKGYITRARLTRSLTNGRVVAELGISFWTSLLRPIYSRTLWPLLRGAFVAYTHRKTLMSHLEPLPAFRNRVAHHEPIYDRRPMQVYDGIIAAAAAISPSLPPWIEHHSRVRECLSEGPSGRRQYF